MNKPNFSIFLCIAVTIVALLAVMQNLALAERGDGKSIYSADYFSSPNLRFGTLASNRALRDTPESWRIHQGFWVNHLVRARPERPNGEDVLQILPIKPDEYHEPSYALTETWPISYVIPYTDSLQSIITSNPGEIWTIGNEMDRLALRDTDGMLACNYAKTFHDLTSLILQWDPTAKIAIGGIVQPTPLRLAYLDLVWDCYIDYYDEPMKVDVWNIHNMVLNEVRNGWGADIPPGFDEIIGRALAIDDHDDMEIFKNQIVAFREWMYDKGEQQKPLIVSEYGILMPKEFGFEEDRTIDFMQQTFDYFLEAQDPALGYAADDNRLVQRWAWFSFDVEDFDFETGEGFNGALFDKETGNIRPEGVAYGLYTAPDVTVDAPSSIVIDMSTSLSFNVLNIGRTEAYSITTQLYDGHPDEGGLLIKTFPLIPAQLPGQDQAIEFVLDLDTITLENDVFVIELDQADSIWEADEENNLVVVEVLESDPTPTPDPPQEQDNIYLPILEK